MKIVKKEDLVNELKTAIAKTEIFEGIGKETKKPYHAIKVTGANGKEVLFFINTRHIMRLGLVVDDTEA
jgi:hypothetical protein